MAVKGERSLARLKSRMYIRMTSRGYGVTVSRNIVTCRPITSALAPPHARVHSPMGRASHSSPGKNRPMETPLERDPSSEPTRWSRLRLGHLGRRLVRLGSRNSRRDPIYPALCAKPPVLRGFPHSAGDDRAQTAEPPVGRRRSSAEHRPIIPKAILATLYRAIPDFRAGLYLNAGLLSTASASMILLARRLRGWTSITDAVLPLSILNIGQSENFLIGFALNLILTAWISYELIVAMCRTSQSPGWWPSLLVGGLLVLLPLSGGSGMAMLPPLMLWLAGYVACGWWSGRGPGAWGRALGLGLLLTTLLVVAFYLNGYERPAHHPSIPSAWAACSTTLEFLSLVIIPVWGERRLGGSV